MARIVAAEDEVDVADWLDLVLGRAGHTVYTALDGPTALELIAVRQPDLVILDQRMPGMTGLQVADRLRADPVTASTPVLTGQVKFEASTRAAVEQYAELVAERRRGGAIEVSRDRHRDHVERRVDSGSRRSLTRQNRNRPWSDDATRRH
ncbi:response regulator [Actinoplanes sp. NEAU-A12]|uniref:Response regulator n=1 Tax=Actinoplanes sandaracinus TaxID=3045177 RepID=A0ABT6WXJ9_9ACTN|nr:response regulator [Actinoplanes sandaracinus]MDI6104331.1 response regulator [Actinoplanes sandaracinus]